MMLWQVVPDMFIHEREAEDNWKAKLMQKLKGRILTYRWNPRELVRDKKMIKSLRDLMRVVEVASASSARLPLNQY